MECDNNAQEKGTFKVVLIPADSTQELKECSLVKSYQWLDGVCELLHCEHLDYVWPKLTGRKQKGGCLLVDRYWYQCDKKDHQNDRATNIYGRALYGDIVLADVYYVDEDENGNELDEGFNQYNDVTIEVYKRFLENSISLPDSKNVLGVYNKSLPEGSKVNAFPEVYRGQDWKGKTPKAILMEYQQSRKGKSPIYSCTAPAPFKCTVTLESIPGKVFDPVNGSPTKKEAEQNAALVALHHLHNLWINRSDEPDSDEDEEVNNTPSTEAATPDPFGLDSTDERSLYQDLTGDGGVLKKIVREGEGEVGEQGAQISDKTKFDSSRERNEPHRFRLGKGQVLLCWDIAVATMKKGECARIVSSADYAYGELGCPPLIPKNATIVFEMEILDIEKWEEVKKRECISATERLKLAAAHKDDGNAFFQKQSWAQAKKSYNKGLQLISTREFKKLDEEQGPFYRQLMISLNLNCAMSYLKLQKWKKALDRCNTVLILEPEAPQKAKTLFRRAVALRNLEEIDKARNDLEQAAALDPSCADECKRESLKLKVRENQVLNRERNMFQKMFSSLGQKENGESSE